MSTTRREAVLAGFRRSWQPASYLALALYFCYPFLAHPTRLGIADWDYFFAQQAVVLKSLFAYGQLPFWNPWACGGNVLWQNPQLALLNPVYLLAPLVSLPVAIKAALFLHYLLGLAGMHLLARRALGVTFFPFTLFLASLFAFAGGIALHLAVGHMSFLSYFYLPMQLFLYLRAAETGSYRAASGAGALVALGVLNGGVYIAALSAVGFGVLGLVLSACRRSWRPVIALGLMALFAGLLSAPKLLPTVTLLRSPSFFDARNPFVPAPMSASLLARSLLDPFLGLSAMLPGQAYAWHEYGNHLGAFGVLLIAASIAWTLLERPWDPRNSLGVALAATALVLFLLLLGETGRYAPAELLKSLPIFSGLRPPSRFTLAFTLFGTAVAGWAAGTALRGVQASGPARRLLATVLLAATLLLANQNRGILAGAFPVAAPPAATAHVYPRTAEPFVDTRTDPYAPNSPMYAAFLRERVVWNCYEPLQLKPVAVPDKPIVYAGPGTTIHRMSFSPNVIRFAATATASEARVYLNQNYTEGWTSDAGPVHIDRENGQAYVTIDPQRPGSYSFRFSPPGLLIGVAISLIGLVLAFLVRDRKVCR